MYYQPPNDIGTALDFLDQSLKISWDLNLKNFPAGTSFDDPRFHGSFIGGGIIGNEPFIAALGRNHNRRQSPVLLTGNEIGWLLTPKHQAVAGDFFDDQMTSRVFGKTFAHVEDRNQAVIECAVNTIMWVSTLDTYVGGKIHYAIKEPNKHFVVSQ